MKSWNSLACSSAVMPMPLSATANSIQLCPSHHLSHVQRDLALLGELAGVAQQVEQDLPQPHRAPQSGRRDSPGFRRPAGFRFARRAGVRCRRPRRSAERAARLCGLSSSFPASILARSSTWLMRPSRWVPAAIHSAAAVPRLLRAETRRVSTHHLGEPDDGVERGAQLVAHAGEELRLVQACQLGAGGSSPGSRRTAVHSRSRSPPGRRTC